jgi:hypothetical protein
MFINSLEYQSGAAIHSRMFIISTFDKVNYRTKVDTYILSPVQVRRLNESILLASNDFDSSTSFPRKIFTSQCNYDKLADMAFHYWNGKNSQLSSFSCKPSIRSVFLKMDSSFREDKFAFKKGNPIISIFVLSSDIIICMTYKS